VTTFVSIMIFAAFVLAGLLTVAAGFILLGRWMIDNTHDADAH
jgi:hypothetical protein